MDTESGELYDDVPGGNDDSAHGMHDERGTPEVPVKGEPEDAQPDGDDAPAAEDLETSGSLDGSSSRSSGSDQEKSRDVEKGHDLRRDQDSEPDEEPFEDSPNDPGPVVSDDVKPNIPVRSRSVIVESLNPDPKSPMDDNIRVN